MVKAILLFLVGLVLLIKGGDWFVDGAVGIAHKFHLPEILIGATIVSIGTTLPEVMVSATSAFKGSGGIAYGNAIGSVICNTALIAAITIAVKPAKVDKKSLKLPCLFFLISSLIYIVFAYIFGNFTRITGAILLLIFATYIFISIKNAKSDISLNKSNSDLKNETDDESKSKNSTFKNIFFLIIGAVLIAVGSDLLVDNGMYIATELKVPETVIALTVVALGTSLPELVTAITSLVKGHGSLSIGNVIGANLFNLVLVNGVAPLVSPFKLPEGKLIFGINSTLVLEIPVMMAVMCILCLPALIRGKLSRIQGIILLLIYFAFCSIQFII